MKSGLIVALAHIAVDAVLEKLLVIMDSPVELAKLLDTIRERLGAI
jgi:hypothetical protein